MNRALLAVVIAVLSSCGGGQGAPQYAGEPPPITQLFGTCAFCHPTQSAAMEPTGRQLRCEECHADRIPGFVGPGHRMIPSGTLVPSFIGASHSLGDLESLGSCAYCHSDRASEIHVLAPELSCEVCHVSRLTLPYGSRHRSLPDSSVVPMPAPTPHMAGPEASFGACALCHNDLAKAVAPFAAELPCVGCHADAAPGFYGLQHREIPGPEIVPSFVGPSHRLSSGQQFGACGYCHASVTQQAARSAGHGSLGLECANCHAEREAGQTGPGHQTVPTCASCHASQRTHHDLPAGTAECTSCHTPHGSDNLFLIQESVTLPSGAARPVEFTQLAGLAEGGLASPSRPGTGLCETCHTQTRFYRSDGSGETHVSFPCFTCHPHAGGFSPR